MWNNYLGSVKTHASESCKNSSWAETKMAIAILAVVCGLLML